MPLILDWLKNSEIQEHIRYITFSHFLRVLAILVIFNLLWSLDSIPNRLKIGIFVKMVLNHQKRLILYKCSSFSFYLSTFFKCPGNFRVGPERQNQCAENKTRLPKLPCLMNIRSTILALSFRHSGLAPKIWVILVNSTWVMTQIKWNIRIN